MSDKITTTHSGVEITYDEHADLWRFIARGRERSSKTLALAKTAIDKPEPSEKPAFTKRQAWFIRYDCDPVEVTITAESEGIIGRESQFWIMNGKQRSKESWSDLYEKTPENDALVEQIKELSKAEQSVRNRKDEAKSKLTRFTDK